MATPSSTPPTLRTGFANRVLRFDSGAARAHAGIAAARRRMVRPISQADGQITAIAHFRGMAVATRNIRDFEDTGIDPVAESLGRVEIVAVDRVVRAMVDEKATIS